MRKYYCDRCGKEVKIDSLTKIPKLAPLSLMWQEQDLAKSAVVTHATFFIEVCEDCRDGVIEDGHDIVNAMKTKAISVEKTKKTTS